MTDFIEKLRNGELSETEIKTFESSLSDTGKQLLKEALAFNTKRQDEDTKLAEREKKVLELDANIKTEEARLAEMKGSGDQFKKEQTLVAENKFFADYSIPAEKQEEYRTKLKTLGNSHAAPELIYKDLEGVHAFLNSGDLLKTQQEKIKMQQQADEEVARAAGGGGGTPPPGGDPKQFSDAAIKLSKDAGITPEAATKIEKEGLTRTIG